MKSNSHKWKLFSDKASGGVQTRFQILERPNGEKFTGRILQKHNENLFAYYVYGGNVYIVSVPYGFRDELESAREITVVKKGGEYVYHSSI